MDRIDRDVAERQILVEILVGADVAAAALQAHFDVELAAFADGGDVDVAVQHFDVGVGFDLPLSTSPGWSDAQANGLDAVAHQLEGNLLQVQDDVGGVFDHAGDRLNSCTTPSIRTAVMAAPSIELEQHAAQALPMVVPNPRSKGCAVNIAVPFGKRLGIDCQTFGFLKAFKHVFLLRPFGSDADSLNWSRVQVKRR